MCDDLLTCPITQSRLVDPVMDPEGHTYEKSAILDWLSREHTSPLTRNRLTPEMLVPNRLIASILASTQTGEGPQQPRHSKDVRQYQNSEDQVQRRQQDRQQAMESREQLSSPFLHLLRHQQQFQQWGHRNQPTNGVYSSSSSVILNGMPVTHNGTLPGGYQVTFNGNSVSVEGGISHNIIGSGAYNTALSAQGCNTNCRDCIGCKDCKDCSNCTGCKDCENCTNCVGCKGLRNQSGCIGQRG